MQRTVRFHLQRRMVPTPTLGIGVALVLLFLVVVSVVVQPPRADGPDALHQALAWARAMLFSAGAIAFLVALTAFVRGAPLFWEPRTARPGVLAGVRRRRDAFTLIAHGGTVDDARAIADATDAREAVQLMCEWQSAHPDEHVLIFAPDGEPLAYRRPAVKPSGDAIPVR